MTGVREAASRPRSNACRGNHRIRFQSGEERTGGWEMSNWAKSAQPVLEVDAVGAFDELAVPFRTPRKRVAHQGPSSRGRVRRCSSWTGSA